MHTQLPPWLAAFRKQLDANVVETHISWLLLTERFVYKLKKPITLPFLDYSSAHRRHAFCEEELRLNRRFAPMLYLATTPVEGTEEWAVKMHRFNEADRLDHVCARGELSPVHLTQLTKVIAAVHNTAAIAAPGTRFGEPERVLAPALENFTELRSLLPTHTDRLSRIETWTRDEFQRQRKSIAQRKREGHVRECHGDLHLGNLVLIDGKVIPFDCIEFNEDFRWIDVASEIAFTYIDLLDHRRPDLAIWLINEWLTETGDFGAIPVLCFYAVYRALVRAKVAAICGDTAGALEYLAMAEQLSSPPSPGLTITFGLSGSGKSYASRAMLLDDPSATTLRLRSDVERKRIHNLTANADSRSLPNEGIYSIATNTRTYAHLARLACALLEAKWSVVVDAAFLKREERDTFHTVAKNHGASFSILECEAPPEELRRRITQRQNDPSEATLEVLERQKSFVEPLGVDERTFVIKH